MSDSVNELFLKLACKTPLPRISESFPAKPYTRAQAKVDASAPPQPPTSPSKKRGIKSEFNIFTDADGEHAPQLPTLKKLKPNARIPLSIKTDLANDTPLPTPRQPDRPFPFSQSDPLWADVENYDPLPEYNLRTNYMTPPSTPGGPSPIPSPYPSPRPSTRAVRRRRAPTSTLPPPRSMTLYLVLHLDSWKATDQQIRHAYRKVAAEFHPDKVAEDARETATQIMQNINAAKEVLLDGKRRRAYHVDGKLPWTT